ncbi:hypothetical protein DS746_p44 (plasmid) [Campylobacter jejuni]|nr:hypothetical protein DS746_p44 [Campylobacter jejuni]
MIKFANLAIVGVNTSPVNSPPLWKLLEFCKHLNHFVQIQIQCLAYLQILLYLLCYPINPLLDEATTVTPMPLTILGFGGSASSIKAVVCVGCSCATSSSNVFEQMKVVEQIPLFNTLSYIIISSFGASSISLLFPENDFRK